MTDFDSDFIYAASEEHDWDEGGYCPALYGDPCRCTKEEIPDMSKTEYDPNAARESKATRAVADFTVWWEQEGHRYGQDRMSMRNAFVAGMIAQLQEERERLLQRIR